MPPSVGEARPPWGSGETDRRDVIYQTTGMTNPVPIYVFIFLSSIAVVAIAVVALVYCRLARRTPPGPRRYIRSVARPSPARSTQGASSPPAPSAAAAAEASSTWATEAGTHWIPCPCPAVVASARPAGKKQEMETVRREFGGYYGPAAAAAEGSTREQTGATQFAGLSAVALPGWKLEVGQTSESLEPRPPLDGG